MKKVFGDEVLEVCPINDGIVAAYCCSEDDEKITVGFRKIDFLSGEVSNIQKSYYMLAKFGAQYKIAENIVGNYLTCSAKELQGDELIIVEKDGTAHILDENGEETKTSRLRYKGEPPKSIAVSGKYLWASFPIDDSIVRFNLKTLREELRLGGHPSTFSQPEGVWAHGDDLFVCNSGSNSIFRISISSYAVEEYITFDEPVHSYMCSGVHEFVWLDSGFYLLENSDF